MAIKSHSIMGTPSEKSLSKERKYNQKMYRKGEAVKKVLEKHGEKKLTIKEQNQKHWADLAKHENTLPTGHGLK